MSDNPSYGRPPARRPMFSIIKWLTLCVILVGSYGFYWWFIERIEVPANKMLILINRSGRAIPDELKGEYTGDQVILYPNLVKRIADETGWTVEQVRNGYKGIQYEVLTEGRYFFSPIWYERQLVDATLIPDDKYGVLIRRYGAMLPQGRTTSPVRMHEEIASPDTVPHRGPVTDTLTPGRHNINLLAYDVQLFDKIAVPEGWNGVETLLSGDSPANPNSFVVEAGERGVQPRPLVPGTYFNKNRYEVRVDLVDMRSQKYDMLGIEAITFPSNDGFNVMMEATVEWALYADQAPRVVVKVGDLEDVVHKVIRPYAMSLARIQGSKLTAREFIGARETFQNRLFADLRTRCQRQGVQIKAVTVRDLKPPETVRKIIRERELADQTMTKYENEINEARAKAALVEQQELANQQMSLGDANREVVSITVKAEQVGTVAVTQANQRLDVAKLDLESARKQAEAILALGQADAKVVLYNYEAEAEPLKASVNAFGDGFTYAQNEFYIKIAPAITSILTSTEGPFSDIFRSFGTAVRPGNASADATTDRQPPDAANSAVAARDEDDAN